MTIFTGSAALAGASSVTAATRMRWACAATLICAGTFSAPLTRGPWYQTMTFASTGGLVLASGPGVGAAHFRIPPYLTVTNLSRVDAAPPAYGAGSFRAVTPSDTVPLDAGCRGLFVVATGTLTVKGVYDSLACSLGTQAAGVTIPGRFGYVMAAGTGATVVALYS